MKNSDYWKNRFIQLEAAQNDLNIETLTEIERQYRAAQKELEGKISVWYGRLAKNNDVSLSEARKLLSKAELKEFKWDVKDYIKYGEENALNGKWLKQLENASAKYHISKLEALKIQVRQSIEALYCKQGKSLSAALGEVYKSGYYNTAYELQKGFNKGFNVGAVDQRQVEKILSKPWAADGVNFSDRIWNNRDKLISELHNQLTRNILTGADPQKAIDEIAKKMNTSKSNAGRLVMTEGAYFSSAAQKDCFNDLGVEKYEIVATLDSHTSEICRSLDGKVYPMKDYEPGVTAPPFHVRCRSTTVPYFDDDFGEIGERAARGKDGKTYYVPADMTYREWKETFVDEDVANSAESDIMELTRNKNSTHRKIGAEGQQIIDTPTYNKLTEKFLKNDGIIIRGKEAEEHLKDVGAHASYLPSLNTAFIKDDATVSDVLEEMYHAEQDRKNMFGKVVTHEVKYRREIDAQKYLLSLTDKYNIPEDEVNVTKANLANYERMLKELLEGSD